MIPHGCVLRFEGPSAKKTVFFKKLSLCLQKPTRLHIRFQSHAWLDADVFVLLRRKSSVECPDQRARGDQHRNLKKKKCEDRRTDAVVTTSVFALRIALCTLSRAGLARCWFSPRGHIVVSLGHTMAPSSCGTFESAPRVSTQRRNATHEVVPARKRILRPRLKKAGACRNTAAGTTATRESRFVRPRPDN